MKISYQSREAQILGKELYKQIVASHNLFTKKPTPGRVKPCERDLKFFCEQKLKNKNKENA